MSSDSENSRKDVPEKVHFSTPAQQFEKVGLENAEATPHVDAATEQRLLRKLDYRIIPMLCWVYLMNFMDRGNLLNPALDLI